MLDELVPVEEAVASREIAASLVDRHAHDAGKARGAAFVVLEVGAERLFGLHLRILYHHQRRWSSPSTADDG
jgi:hypothetical protein